MPGQLAYRIKVTVFILQKKWGRGDKNRGRKNFYRPNNSVRRNPYSFAL
jgi:hypothetical protein